MTACETPAELDNGNVVCDKIRSNVHIYYLMQEHEDATFADLSPEDKQDMYNLLIETIYNQAEVGSFASVGDVASVEIADEDGTTGDNTDNGDDGTNDKGSTLNDVPDPSGGSTTFQDKKGPILAAAAGFAALFAGGYWYAQGEDPEEDGQEKNEQTDESDAEDHQGPVSG